MNNENQQSIVKVSGEKLLERVISILEQARANVIKSVNSNMVIAYWLIGREIVNEIQLGQDRAEYGKKILIELSDKLTNLYGKGFSVTNLRYFRLFFQTFSERIPEIRHIASDELEAGEKHHKPCDVLENLSMVLEKTGEIKGFSPLLSWSHYRTLTKVENTNERLFYEIEAEKERWSVPHLQRQIETFLFARLFKSRDKKGVMELSCQGQVIESASDIIKNPYILDFLGIPESQKLHESNLEQTIIDKLQDFLLELGKGFAFVARQKRISTETKEFYIDLVFYNYYLKCFILVDLKTGELTHQDIGQMDMYVRMFDDIMKGKDDNPTVGLILCTEKDKAIVKYSVLNENEHLFASKYMLYLPSEEVLIQELEREKRLLEMERNENE